MDRVGVVGTKVVVDASQMLTHLAATELIYLIDQPVQELTVVADDDGCAVKSLDCLLEHILRLHVQVVGWLIEYQQIDRLQQELDHRQTTAFSTTQHLHIFFRSLASKHKGTQQVIDFETHFTSCHTVDGIVNR